MNNDVRPHVAAPAAPSRPPQPGHQTHQPHQPQPHHPPIAQMQPSRFWSKLLNNLKPVLITLLIVVILGLGYAYWHTKQQLNDATSAKASQAATQDLVAKIGKLVILPSDETPTTATVNNAAKLKSQQFFAKSQDGDKVLIYSKSGQAVLYRPSVNKVVEYTQISFNNSNTP